MHIQFISRCMCGSATSHPRRLVAEMVCKSLLCHLHHASLAIQTQEAEATGLSLMPTKESKPRHNLDPIRFSCPTTAAAPLSNSVPQHSHSAEALVCVYSAMSILSLRPQRRRTFSVLALATPRTNTGIRKLGTSGYRSHGENQRFPREKKSA